MDREKLQEIARQLREPNGAKGIEMADMMHETNINMTLQAIEQLHVQDHDIILELGHGNCKHLELLLHQKNNLTYHGLETSRLMHDQAQQINHQIKDSACCFHVYDGLQIPFPADYFDKIFTVNTVYFWKEPISLLLELYRVLKPKGLLCITFAQQEFMEKLPFTQFEFDLYTNDKLTQLLKSTAFKVIHIDSKSEKVKSKTNELVTRDYTTFVLQK